MLTEKDEYRHTPTSDLNWQESTVLIWYDPATEVGGFHRIGLEPNQGKCNTQSYIAKGKQLLYKIVNMDLPLSPNDWDNYPAGPIQRKTQAPLKDFQFVVDDPFYNIKAELTFKGFHPAHDYSRGLDTEGQVAANHFEGAGLVSGWVDTPRGRHEIQQGVGMRDHSWGVRHWNIINNWRWVCAIFGQDCAFNVMTMVTDSATLHAGFLYDGKETLAVTDCSIHVLLEDNGKEHKGTQLWFKDENGRTFEATSETIFSSIVRYYAIQANEGLSKFTMGGREGYGIVEYGYR